MGVPQWEFESSWYHPRMGLPHQYFGTSLGHLNWPWIKPIINCKVTCPWILITWVIHFMFILTTISIYFAIYKGMDSLHHVCGCPINLLLEYTHSMWTNPLVYGFLFVKCLGIWSLGVMVWSWTLHWICMLESYKNNFFSRNIVIFL